MINEKRLIRIAYHWNDDPENRLEGFLGYNVRESDKEDELTLYNIESFAELLWLIRAEGKDGVEFTIDSVDDFFNLTKTLA